jgi:hypothetical protein
MTNIFLQLGFKAAQAFLKIATTAGRVPGNKQILQATSLRLGASPTTLKQMAKERVALQRWKDSLARTKSKGIKIDEFDGDVIRINKIVNKQWSPGRMGKMNPNYGKPKPDKRSR